MSEKFIFKGKTTLIHQPYDTVIQNFQNTYITNDDTDRDKANLEIERLMELVLESKDLPNDKKEEVVQALHSIAELIKEQKGSKLTLKGALQAVQSVVSKAADIAAPALGIIATVLKILDLAGSRASGPMNG
ncbi:MAG: hypothetical protein WED00_12290 [Aquisalimonadaceae bacterium]